MTDDDNVTERGPIVLYRSDAKVEVWYPNGEIKIFTEAEYLLMGGGIRPPILELMKKIRNDNQAV